MRLDGIRNRPSMQKTVRTLELKVDKERQVINTLTASRQFGKDQESAPALTLICHAHTLPDDSERLKVALGDATRPNGTQSPDPSVEEEDVGHNDGDGEDPFDDVEADNRLDLTGPLIKGKEVDGREGIGSVDGDREDDENPQPAVGDGRKARARLEVGE